MEAPVEVFYHQQPSLPLLCEQLWHRQTLPSLSWQLWYSRKKTNHPFQWYVEQFLFFTFTLNCTKIPHAGQGNSGPGRWRTWLGLHHHYNIPQSKGESWFSHSPPSKLLTLCIHCEDIFGYCWMKQHCGIPTLEDKFPSLAYWHLTKLLRSSRNLMYSWCSRAVLSSINSSAKVLSTPLSARKSIRWS